MPLYIYSLVRRGVTPEINALSSVLLAGSIGLVGLSLTAQNGGPVYTRAMSVGAGAGLGLFGLFGLSRLFAPDGFSVGGLVLQLLLMLGFLWAWRSFNGYREELETTNRSGKVLAWVTVLVAGFAAFLSALLLTS